MTIQKKSLISNLNATKKAIVVSQTSTSIQPTGAPTASKTFASKVAASKVAASKVAASKVAASKVAASKLIV